MADPEARARGRRIAEIIESLDLTSRKPLCDVAGLREVRDLAAQLTEAEAPDVRKTFERLIAELDEHRKLKGKVFVHVDTREKFQLIDFQFDEVTNVLRAHYCRVTFPRIKYGCPLAHFLERFEEWKGDD